MRLLRAELRKLRRPLLYWTAVAVVAVSAFLVWGGEVNSVVTNPPRGGVSDELVPNCEFYNLPPGPECARRQQVIRESNQRDRRLSLAASRLAKAGQQPLGAGRFAAGLLASLVGVGALMLLAAGHVGGEWSGRTIKSLLVQDGRRGRLLAAKAASLWLTGVAMLALTWVALALLAPLLAARFNNPTVLLPAGEAAGTALAQSARALLVLAVFSVLGVAAAVLTRNALGTFALGFGVILLSQVLFGIDSVTRWTPAYWVTGWMGFRQGNVPADYLWSVQLPPGVPGASAELGLVALLVFLAATATATWLVFARSDITA